jgi:VWFA-related protein
MSLNRTSSFAALAFAALICPAVVLIAAAQAPQAPRPGDTAAGQPAVTFRLEVNYVEVDAAVFDKQGKFVSTLTKDDFQVLEDGVPQDVSAFSLVNIPIERADRPLYAQSAIRPDVVSNARPFDGRLYVIVLDDLHTQPYHTPQVRAAAKQFIDRYMADNDLAAVVHTSGKTDAAQEFTSDKRRLDAAVDRFMGQALESLTLSRQAEYQRQQSMPPGAMGSGSRIEDPLDAERGYKARQSLDALKGISDWVAAIRGRRKAIVFLSEGIEYNTYDFNNRESSNIINSMRDAIAAATRSNVSIYAVDPRGLTTMGDTTILASGDFPADPQMNLSLQSFQEELRMSQDSLRSLADETGGYAAVNMNDFKGAWERVVKDNSSYYVLGYYPKNDKRDGRFRKIEVKLRNHDGLDVRSRRGYTAPRGKVPSPKEPSSDKASPELREALDSPLPLPGITLRAFAAPFRGEAPNASVAVSVEAQGNDLQFAQKNGKFVDQFELSAIAVDNAGKVRDGDRSLIDMGLKPETHARVAQTGVRMQTRLKIPPGRYQLRVAARETGAGRVGTVAYDLDVPDFSSQPLTMSGIAITAASQQLVMTAQPDKELGTALPAPATAVRDFPVNDTLALFVEVYDNALKDPHKVNITTTVLADDGHVVFNSAEERASSELSGKTGGYGHTAQIPLKGFAPGLYTLKIEAKSSLGKEPPSVSREVPFRVVAGR